MMLMHDAKKYHLFRFNATSIIDSLEKPAAQYSVW